LKRPALFFDFDNTITQGDVLDRVIERYSATEAWREWETEWQAGRLATPDCLARQVGDLRATTAELAAFVSAMPIDAGFPRIEAWARARGYRVEILTDNFRPLVAAILAREGLGHVPTFANELESDGERHTARFPLRDPHCPRCAHCKAVRLREAVDVTRIFVGDGLSDVCGALAADVVYAKDSLARTLAARGVPFTAYGTLDDVLESLRIHFPDP
jgi:2-hydroxy-3-keto-5-methylthiopentenyl-1-phosphate phosphatase